MTNQQFSQEIFIFDPPAPQGKGPGGRGRRMALTRLLFSAVSLLGLLLYALSYNTGLATFYWMGRVGGFFNRQLERAQDGFVSWRARAKKQIRFFLKQKFRPFKQFALIFVYVRSTRDPMRMGERIPLLKVVRVVAGRILHGLWRLIITLINIAAPVCAIWLFVLVLHHYTGMRYGLAVEYKGAFIGNVESEAQFYAAEKLMKDRLMGVQAGDAQEELPRFTFKAMPPSSYTDVQEMADTMMRLSGSELFEGYGVYIDSLFVGALADCQPLLRELDSRLDAAYDGTPGESVAFNHRFQVVEALYPTTAEITGQSVVARLDTELSGEKHYTVVEGDVPINIAKKNGMPYAELLRLNPQIETTLLIGDELLIANRVPYLRILKTKVESVTEEIPFVTTREVDNNEPIGYNQIKTEGKPGTRRITSNVTYVDGEVLSSEVIETKVVREPRDQVLVVGGKEPKVPQQQAPAQGTGPVDTSGDVISASGAFIWPVDGGKITMPIWGYYNHTGNDITGIAAGTAIRAAADGIVTDVRYTTSGYGRYVVITHPNGMKTLYAHNSANLVQVGQEVKQGQKIAEVGQTGNAYGNHCHFEIRQGGAYLDARQYIGSVSPR